MNDIKTKCTSCRKYLDCSTGSGITWPCGAYVPVSMTNGDYIRSMTDEELAEAITFNMFFNCVICPEDKRLSDNPLEDDACDGRCTKHCMEWLKEPYEGGDKDE